ALAIMMQSTAFLQRHADHLLLGCGGRLVDRFGHFAGLAVTEPDAPLAVAPADQSRKPEALSALHGLRDTVDVDQLLDQVLAAVVASPAATIVTPPTPAPATTAIVTTATTAAPSATRFTRLRGCAARSRLVVRSLGRS